MEFELLFMAQDSAGLKCNSEDLVRDLRLDILFDVMSGGDRAIHDACSAVMTHPLTDMESILARSAVVMDAIAHDGAFVELFRISCEAVDSVRAHLKIANPKYDRIIPNKKKIITETEIAELNIKHLYRLKAVLARHSAGYSSDAMRGLCHTVDTLFENGGLTRAESRVQQLGALKSMDGLAVEGRIGEGLKQTDVLLSGLSQQAIHGKRRPGADEVVLPLSSMALIRNAEEIIESALAPVHRAINSFNRAIQSFFEKLRFQTGFFVGCVNLRRRLEALNVPLCYPQFSADCGEYAGRFLVDVSLALKESCLPTANDFCFTGKRQVVITGPNQGGKTTFLRSVGLAQVMAQCGMFVAAQEYFSPLFSGVFTHFPGTEDDGLKMGLLEVELRKLNGIVDAIKPGGLLLMNESFQSTMPLDAKRLAEEIVSALVDAGIMVLFVTHLYAYAIELYGQRRIDALLLRAQRGQNVKNTYQIREGEPFKSAFGLELFRELIGS
jgi:hypothetical protein